MFWLLVSLICLMVQFLYWYLVFNNLEVKKPPSTAITFYPVSLVICAHSAVQHLKKNLHTFLVQDYPEFEVILVDDGSTDETAEWIQEQISGHPLLRYYRIEKTAPGKKAALAFGISKAKHDWIAVSDADCRTLSTQWLRSMMKHATGPVKIIIGYSPYDKMRGWLNKFIRFETLLNAIQYLSSALHEKAYMGVGRNMVYHKSIFDEKVIRKEMAQGDDDLLVTAKAGPGNTAVCMDADSFICSTPSSTYYSYFKQKWRHYATAKYYSLSIQFFLALFFISLLGFFMSLFVLLLLKSYSTATLIYFCHIVMIMPVFCKYSRLFDEQDLCKYFPALTLWYCIHLCLEFPFLWIKKKKW